MKTFLALLCTLFAGSAMGQAIEIVNIDRKDDSYAYAHVKVTSTGSVIDTATDEDNESVSHSTGTVQTDTGVQTASDQGGDEEAKFRARSQTQANSLYSESIVIYNTSTDVKTNDRRAEGRATSSNYVDMDLKVTGTGYVYTVHYRAKFVLRMPHGNEAEYKHTSKINLDDDNYATCVWNPNTKKFDVDGKKRSAGGTVSTINDSISTSAGGWVVGTYDMYKSVAVNEVFTTEVETNPGASVWKSKGLFEESINPGGPFHTVSHLSGSARMSLVSIIE